MVKLIQKCFLWIKVVQHESAIARGTQLLQCKASFARSERTNYTTAHGCENLGRIGLVCGMRPQNGDEARSKHGQEMLPQLLLLCNAFKDDLSVTLTVA